MVDEDEPSMRFGFWRGALVVFYYYSSIAGIWATHRGPLGFDLWDMRRHTPCLMGLEESS